MTESKWYYENGPQGDVVLSTRIRLARNLSDLPFPESMSVPQRRELLSTVRNGIHKDHLTYLDMEQMSDNDALSLVERHLISPEFAQNREQRGLFLSEDESVSIMVGEEDHLRIQVMAAGLQPDQAYAKADALDTELDQSLHFAFDDRLGYLTQCPTNLGTGMRASLMLHLPALEKSGAIHALSNTVSKLGLTIRGMYGEGSRSEGAIYQLSNQVSLGLSEKEAIQNLVGIVNQIIKEERTARETLCRNPRFVDTVYRSLGVLRYARMMSHEELLSLLSYLRIGVSGQVLTDVSLAALNRLMSDTQPSTLMMLARRDMTPEERDTLRADKAREWLNPD